MQVSPSSPQTIILYFCIVLALWPISSSVSPGVKGCLCSYHPNVYVATQSSDGGEVSVQIRCQLGSRAHEGQMSTLLPRTLRSSSKSSFGLGPDGHREAISMHLTLSYSTTLQ